MAKQASVHGKDGEGIANATLSSQDLQEKSEKPAGTSDEDWEEMDLKAASTIQLCFADEVMSNEMDEETTTGL